MNLLLVGYDGVSQFFPGVILGLFWKRITRTGVLYGMGAGIGLVFFLVLGGYDPLLGMNAGFFALIVNGGITVFVSLITSSRRNT